MARPRLDIGTFGDIWFDTDASGRVVARTRYREWDGRRRLVQAGGTTEKVAERALKKKLAERSLFQPAAGVLTPDSGFGELVDYWLEHLDLEGHLSTTTRQLYERNMRTLIPRVSSICVRAADPILQLPDRGASRVTKPPAGNRPRGPPSPTGHPGKATQ
jgi:hypothetical protein